jgi:hypothetical protein
VSTADGKDGLAVIIVDVDGGSPAYWTPIALTGAAGVSTEFVDELCNSAARDLKSHDVSGPWSIAGAMRRQPSCCGRPLSSAGSYRVGGSRPATSISRPLSSNLSIASGST